MRTNFLIFLLTISLLMGCSTQQDDPIGTDASQTESGGDSIPPQDFQTNVRELLRVSRESVVPTTYRIKEDLEMDGYEPKPRDISIPPVESLYLYREELPPSPGQRVLILDEIPSSIAITSTESVYFSNSEGIFRVKDNGEVVQLREDSQANLMVDELGYSLLVQSTESAYFYQENENHWIDLGKELPSGKLFWGLKSGELTAISEQVAFAATVETRIQLMVRNYDVASKYIDPVTWDPRPYAALGTLPTIGAYWGHELQPYQLDPVPAPLILIVNGKPVAYLTETEDAADVSPAMAGNSDLFWVRTYQRGSKTGRAHYRSLTEDSSNSVQLTSLPTYQITINPSGSAGVYVIESEDNNYELWKFSRRDLDSAKEISASRMELDEEVRQKFLGIRDELWGFLESIDAGKEFDLTPAGPAFAKAPALSEFLEAGEILKNALSREFSVPWKNDLRDLEYLDQLLDSAVGVLEEEPATVLALSGLLIKILEPETELAMEEIRPALSADIIDFYVTDELTIAAATPFLLARDRLNTGLSLKESVEMFLQSPVRPLYLVENFSAETFQNIQRKELIRAGLQDGGGTLDDFIMSLRNHPDNNTLAVTVMRLAEMENDVLIAVWAAYQLAKNNPGNSRALTYLASYLSDMTLFQEAQMVFERAWEIDPSNLDALLGAADNIMLQDDLEGSKKYYEEILRLSTESELTELVSARIEMIEHIMLEEAP